MKSNEATEEGSYCKLTTKILNIPPKDCYGET